MLARRNRSKQGPDIWPGFVDAIYDRKEINDKIISILKILLHKHNASSEVNNELTDETSENYKSARKQAS